MPENTCASLYATRLSWSLGPNGSVANACSSRPLMNSSIIAGRRQATTAIRRAICLRSRGKTRRDVNRIPYHLLLLFIGRPDIPLSVRPYCVVVTWPELLLWDWIYYNLRQRKYTYIFTPLFVCLPVLSVVLSVCLCTAHLTIISLYLNNLCV